MGHKGERDLTGNEMIPFKVIHFREGGKQKGGNNNEEERPQIKNSLKNGRMAVTSQRIIFICLNESGENAIKKVKKNEKIKVDHYTVDASFTHTTVFFPMDLQVVKHIRFRMTVTIKSKKRIKPVKSKSLCQGCGKGCALCLRACCDCCFCFPKTWLNSDKDGKNTEKKD